LGQHFDDFVNCHVFSPFLTAQLLLLNFRREEPALAKSLGQQMINRNPTLVVNAFIFAITSSSAASSSWSLCVRASFFGT
jgi:hypothetical protein